MRFDRLDLNLLAALDVLLTERSVSRAAEGLCLSQSATSSALGRLRDYFDDDLLVLNGRTMELTPRAEELREPVRNVLEQIRSTISMAPEFDPSTSARHITIIATDYATDVLFSKVASYLAREAPKMVFEIIPLTDSVLEPLERRTVDMLITLDVSVDARHPTQVLFDDEFVVVAWDQNPHVKKGITRQNFVELGHLATHFFRTKLLSFPDWILQSQVPERRIELYAPTFLTIPSMIVGTNRIALMPRRIAENAARFMPLKIMQSPVPIPQVNMIAMWHKANDRDEAIRWTASALARAGRVENQKSTAQCSVDSSYIRDLSAQYRGLTAHELRQ